MTELGGSSDSVPEASGAGPLLLADVYLLTAESGGRTALPGLSLVLDPVGITVHRPDGTMAAVVAWSDMTGCNASRRMRTPAGQPGAVLEAVTGARAHRFLVPADDPDALERDVVHAAAVAGVGVAGSRPGRRRRRSRRLFRRRS